MNADKKFIFNPRSSAFIGGQFGFRFPGTLVARMRNSDE
jgi:hypothetical protein